MANGVLKNKIIILAAFMVIPLFLTTNVFAGAKDDYKQKKLEFRRKRIKAVKLKLDGTVWDITVYQSGAKRRKKPRKDVLVFSDGKIQSENMVAEGFNSSNFSLRIKGESIVIWETMQNSEDKGLAFWKGEIENGVMRGVFSWHLDEKTIKNHTFVSEKQSIKLIPTEGDITRAIIKPKEQATEVKSTKEEIKVESKVEEKPKAQVRPKEVIPKKKKKRGWFW